MRLFQFYYRTVYGGRNSGYTLYCRDAAAAFPLCSHDRGVYRGNGSDSHCRRLSGSRCRGIYDSHGGSSEGAAVYYFIVVLQQLEGNLIYPKVVGSSIGLPGIWVLAAVTVGGGLGGIGGMLLGVPVAATVYKLIRNDVNRRNQSEKKIPVEGAASARQNGKQKGR